MAVPASTTPARPVTVIVNARAGLSPRPDRGEEILDLFRAAGSDVRLERVPGSAIAGAARKAAGRGDILVAAGGDGTVSATAAVAAETAAVFGVLPVGTLNHFARDVGIPLDLAAAVEAILAGRVQALDAGELNGRIFVNNSSVGLYPRMVRAREEEQRRGLDKRRAFGLALLRTWRQYRTLVGQIVVDGRPQVVRTPFIFIGNNEYVVEGLRVGARAALDAGRLSVIVAPDCGRFEILALPVRAVLGRIDPDAHLSSQPADEVVVELSRRSVNVALDGEVVTMRTPLRYRIRRRLLRTLVPAAPAAREQP